MRRARRTAFGSAFAGGAVALAGCDVVFGLHAVTHDAKEHPPIDAAASDVASDAPGATSCLDVRTGDPSAPSGRYTIDPDGPGSEPPLTVACDMTTDGGGWTIVFVAPSTNLAAVPLAYTTVVPHLMTVASDALVAYRDASLTAQPGTAVLPMPAEWRTDTPFDYPSSDVPTTVRIDGATAVPGTLRYGFSDFNLLCSDGWNTAAAWGRICIDGTAAPFYAGFDHTAADTCTDSTQAFNTTACAADRQLSIAVR